MSKNLRIEALEQQLIQSSQESSREIAVLRAKILDFEIHGSSRATSIVDEANEIETQALKEELLTTLKRNQIEGSTKRTQFTRHSPSQQSHSSYSDLAGKVHLDSVEPSNRKSRASTSSTIASLQERTLMLKSPSNASGAITARSEINQEFSIPDSLNKLIERKYSDNQIIN